ncbi:hypothetical protein AB1Y20_019238 [Prymnesium parvum]|uniref:Uncharacterized protein n=1 Tax=Prymnesium parvum TaxID=97485 RepID=A0AB34JR55_PRYPA
MWTTIECSLMCSATVETLSPPPRHSHVATASRHHSGGARVFSPACRPAPRNSPPRSTVLFTGTAGDSRKLDAAFRASLLGERPLSVDPAHWILTVLPSLSPAAVTMRLLVFVFLPAFVLANDLDEEVGSVLFYPAPVCFSRLLHRLIKEGISAEPAPDIRALRAARPHPLLPTAARGFPPIGPGPDAHNGVLTYSARTLRICAHNLATPIFFLHNLRSRAIL